jgi:hypothetical protein
MPDEGGKQDAGDKKEPSWFITFEIKRAQEFLVLSRSSPCQVRPWRLRLDLKEICPRGNNNIVIIIFLVHDNVYTPW